jgi:hypothetical protein
MLKDGAPLYRALDLAITIMIEQFASLPSGVVEVAISNYKAFEENSKTLKIFYELGNRMSTIMGISSPKFTTRPKDLLQSLSDFAGTVNPPLSADVSELQLSKSEIEL